jgi:hypothetical protein
MLSHYFRPQTTRMVFLVAGFYDVDKHWGYVLLSANHVRFGPRLVVRPSCSEGQPIVDSQIRRLR